MITVKNNVFKIDTPNTTYMFFVNNFGYLQQLYYGARVGDVDDVSFIVDKGGQNLGTSVGVINKQKERFFPDDTCLEISSVGRGDYRESLLIARDGQNNEVFDLTFDSYCFVTDFAVPNLPNTLDKEQTLAVTVKDAQKGLTVTTYYSTHTNCDVITKSVCIKNDSTQEIRLERAFSSQLDLPEDDYVLDSYYGAWAKERQLNSTSIAVGVTKIDSKKGISSNSNNPYIVVKKQDCTLSHGDAYGINLVYSGNHAEVVERNSWGKIRILNGINDSHFSWHLPAGDCFYTPESTLCFSDKGTSELAKRYHKFVNEHIVPKQWQYKQRPILINNWEATYFGFTEKKLLDLAKKAKDLGIELFVLDDGWFGKRTNDTKGLGDWTENKSRLPKGLKGLAEKINNIGLQFGVWVEPEMVNPDSDLYRAHPDWAIAHPLYNARLCRNQLCLDLSNEDVCNYIIECMSRVFSSANISYVKWDYNRPVCDWYSPTCKDKQGEFLHRYILGYYKIMDALTKKFPNILFEGCASGGNRFDLGALCYTPQIWCSDNSDSFDRVKIHEGTLACYPQSCIGSHVSASPNHQTLRNSHIDHRFNTACIGAFGYELDLTALNKADLTCIKKQIEWYKKYRETLQFGEYTQLSSVFTQKQSKWVIVNSEKTQAVANITNTIAQTIPPQDVLKVPNLLADAKYKMQTRQQLFNLKMFGGLINHVSPVHLDENGKIVEILDHLIPMKSEQETYVLTGDMLRKMGVKLNQQWASNGYDSSTRIMLDFGSRLYSIDKID